jgi:16S rRNA (cytosine967-C5)-methyltransferase
MDVSQLPGFGEGEVSVQDSSAQLTARLMNPKQGERILDACAAPGGKACHLLELQPDLRELVALDISETRLRRVTENTQRLGLTLTTAVADSAHLPDSVLAAPFDAILADVPCSATGVIRRNPDIKILRQAEDIDRFARQQLTILSGLWPALKPGGRMLYVTCSLLQRENDDIVSTFCKQHGGQTEQISLPEGVARDHGWQVLPHPEGGDGLYFAMLLKPSN